MRIAFVFAAAVLFVSSPRASAADIAMLATGATKEIVLELIAQFEKRTGHKVVPTWTGTAGIRKRIGDGEIYDLVIVGAPVIDSFIAQGKVAPGSRTELMKSAVGVAVRAGASKPDIGSSEAVKAMLRPPSRLATPHDETQYANLHRRNVHTGNKRAESQQEKNSEAGGVRVQHFLHAG